MRNLCSTSITKESCKNGVRLCEKKISRMWSHFFINVIKYETFKSNFVSPYKLYNCSVVIFFALFLTHIHMCTFIYCCLYFCAFLFLLIHKCSPFDNYCCLCCYFVCDFNSQCRIFDPVLPKVSITLPLLPGWDNYTFIFDSPYYGIEKNYSVIQKVTHLKCCSLIVEYLYLYL